MNSFEETENSFCDQSEQIQVKSNSRLQGDPNQNLKCVLAITLKLHIFDPMLVKPKCAWEARTFVLIFQLFVYNL